MSMISWCKGKLVRTAITDEHKQSMQLTEMEEYAKYYPGCKFVGFWCRFDKYSEYDKLIAKATSEFSRKQHLINKHLAMKDNLPWPANLVDETQCPSVLKVLADYLDECSFGLHYMGPSTCRICSKRLGCSDRTDDEWVWPDKLSHYLLVHKIRLPDDFVEHVFKSRRAYG